ncbi:YDG/SRA domain-containing protein [Kitasatospora brasiliensis]|uniref:YDG/SRA domain-containing protein n=1 Tax=Kitasatospora brasiliensis TaxID=3058040 RepID=UPI0029319667|nr:YDG/SRA domain-containing protein [Kitasatospora sp. K002]
MQEVLPVAPIDFDGYGYVPGIDVGLIFASRRELSEAKVHRPLQAGICGTAEFGAESIVVSGGYEDDEDYGDVIVYTGQGGRDLETKRQVRDQELTRGNAALVTSQTIGAPVRVVRAVEQPSRRSAKPNYRYDGLFRVEDSWHDTGRSGFRIWRYRLVSLSNSVPAQREPTIPEPVGRDTPTRLEAKVQRIVRSIKVANFVKRAHGFACQVCGAQLRTPTGVYAEAAHIRGLGQPHNGPDVAGNVLCLCPNHHTLFDFGTLAIADDLTIIDRSSGAGMGRLREAPGHRIDPAHLAYHREHYSEGWKHSADPTTNDDTTTGS